MRPRRINILPILWLAFAFAGAGQSACATQMLVLDGRTMGTTWQVTVAPATPLDRATLEAGIQAQLDRVDGQMSTWKPDSDLRRFNAAPAGSCHVLAEQFFEVLRYALEVAHDSEGAYDPTVGSLVNLWGFGPEHRPRQPPSAEAIAAARAQVGWQRIKLDADTREACQPGGVQLDLSAVAKGFGVDEVTRWLLAQGMHDFLVEVGGELRGHGHKPDGSHWRVAVEQPDAAAGRIDQAAQMALVLQLDDRAIATSGDYRHFFEDGGRSYSHHIDPRNGWPVPHRVASVTVVADSAMRADPLGTTLSVLGPEAGMAWARQRNLAVLMIVRGDDGLEQHMTPAFEALLRP